MPFITIEMTDTLQFVLQPFSSELHRYLHDALNIPIEKMKTKLCLLSDGSVHVHEPYARLKIELKRGRDKQKLIACGNDILPRFKRALQEHNRGASCRITVEFHEIDDALLFAAQ